MVFERTKKQNGRTYTYMQKSVRDGKKVRSIHISYLGTALADNAVAGAKLDTRTPKEIAADARRTATVVVDTPAEWKKIGFDKSDLRGWDDRSIHNFTKFRQKNLKFVIASLKETFPHHQVDGRGKSVESVFEKLKRRNEKHKLSPNDLTDFVGTRVTFKNQQEIRDNIPLFRSKFKVIGEDDYNTNPKEGYRAHHFLIDDGKGGVAEVQFRTVNQTKWGDWVHDRFYKWGKKALQELTPAEKRAVIKYSHDVSEYFAKVDSGERAEAPIPPAAISKVGDVFDSKVLAQVFIPSSDRAGKPIPPKQRAKELTSVKTDLSKKFGGYTQIEGKGGWIGENGLITEPVTIVQSIAPDTHATQAFIRKKGKKVADNLDQESVLVNIERGENPVFIDGTAQTPKNQPSEKPT